MTDFMQYTRFRDISGETLETVDTAWTEFSEWVRTLPPARTKAECQLISLSVFGDKRAASREGGAGSLRHGGNVIGVWGAEADYDGESISFEEAGRRLAASGVKFLLYTSPSHAKDAPRWRVIVPFDEMKPPEARSEAVQRLNGIFGGVIASESFSLSQPFYAGPVEGGEWLVGGGDGGSILGRADIPAVPKSHRVRQSGAIERVSQSDLVDNILAGVEMHPSIRDLAWFYGWGQEELEDLLHKSKLRDDDPRKFQLRLKSDIPRAVNSAIKKRQEEIEAKLAGAPPPPRPPMTKGLFVHVSDMLAAIRPVKWLIRGIIEAESQAMLFGEPEAGKSFLAVDIAASVATGRDWRGRKVTQGPVMYLAGEGVRGMARRLIAWKMENGVALARDVPLWFSERGIPLSSDDGLKQLYSEIEKLPAIPSLIVVDTLTRMFPGADQNAGRDMAAILQRLDAIKDGYGCTVLTVHHSGHGDKTRAKGAIDLKGGLDAEMGLVKGAGGTRILTCTKSKDSAKFDDMHFRFKGYDLPYWEDGNPIRPGDNSDGREVQKSAVLVTVDKAETVAAADGETPGAGVKNNEIVKEILRGAGSTGLIKDEIIDEFHRLKGGTRATARRVLARSLKSMTEAGVIVHDTESGAYVLPFG